MRPERLFSLFLFVVALLLFPLPLPPSSQIESSSRFFGFPSLWFLSVTNLWSFLFSFFVFETCTWSFPTLFHIVASAPLSGKSSWASSENFEVQVLSLFAESDPMGLGLEWPTREKEEGQQAKQCLSKRGRTASSTTIDQKKNAKLFSRFSSLFRSRSLTQKEVFVFSDSK